MRLDDPELIFVFDCDGCLLDSNRVKTKSLENALELLGLFRSEVLVCLEIFRRNFGKTRTEWIGLIVEKLISQGYVGDDLADHLKVFYEDSLAVKYLQSPPLSGVESLLNLIAGEKYVCSGGLQAEVNQALEQQGLAKYFQSIVGAPVKKISFLTELQDANQGKRVIYLGDNKSDLDAALAANVTFIGLWGESMTDNFVELCAAVGCRFYQSCAELEQAFMEKSEI